MFVPARIVTGRSVLSRSVKQGTPRYVVSSCSPPESVSTAVGVGLQREEVEVADRLEHLHVRGDLHAGHRLAGPWMGGEHDRQLVGDRVQLRDHVTEQWPVDQRRAMQGHEQIVTRREPQPRRFAQIAEARLHRDEAVNHRVADEVDPIRGNARLREDCPGPRRSG